jgi:hypothetical protein
MDAEWVFKSEVMQLMNEGGLLWFAVGGSCKQVTMELVNQTSYLILSIIK